MSTHLFSESVVHIFRFLIHTFFMSQSTGSIWRVDVEQAGGQAGRGIGKWLLDLVEHDD